MTMNSVTHVPQCMVGRILVGQKNVLSFTPTRYLSGSTFARILGVPEQALDGFLGLGFSLATTKHYCYQGLLQNFAPGRGGGGANA